MLISEKSIKIFLYMKYNIVLYNLDNIVMQEL